MQPLEKLLRKLRKLPLVKHQERAKVALSIADLIMDSVAYLDLTEIIDKTNKPDYFTDLKVLVRKEIANAYLNGSYKRYLCLHTRNIKKSSIIEDLGFETQTFHFIRPNIVIVDLQSLEIVNNFI